MKILVVAALTLTACAQQGQSPLMNQSTVPAAKAAPSPAKPEPAVKTAEPAPVSPSLLKDSSLSYHLLLAQIAADRGQDEVAASNFVFVADDLKQPQLYQQAGLSALKSQRWDLLERAAQGWLKQQPEQIDAQLWLIISAAAGTGKDLASRLQQWLDNAQWQPELMAKALPQLLRYSRLEPLLAASQTNQRNTNMRLLHASLLAINLELQASIDELVGLLQQQPTNVQAQDLVLGLYLRLGDVDGAEPWLTRWSKLPLSLERRIELADYWRRLEQSERAQTMLEQGLQQQPDWLEGRLQLALLFWQQQQLDAAVEQLLPLQRAGWQPERVNFSLASIRLQQKQFEAAEALAAQVQQPELQSQFRLWLAQAQVTLAPQQAQQNFAILYRDWPEQQGLWLSQELLSWFNGQNWSVLSQRLAHWQQADPSNLYLHLMQLRMKLAQQRPAEALRYLQQQLALLNPEQQSRLLVWSWSLFVESPEPAAQLPLMAALSEHRPADLELTYALALYRARLKQWPLALLALDGLLKQQPSSADYLNAKGYVLLESGAKVELALPLIQRAQTQAPESAAVLDSLGWAYHLAGQPELANKWLKRAWFLNKDIEIGQHLSVVLRAQGQVAALQQLQQQMQQLLPSNNPIIPLVGPKL